MDARYPIGEFSFDAPLDASSRSRAERIATLAALPMRLRDALAGISAAEWGRRHRPGGWTVREIVHHVPDSHLNGYIRFKWALTESEPTIKPYDEGAWVRVGDDVMSVATSLDLLDALHRRWVALLRAMRDADFERAYVHPEHGRRITLDQSLANYAWHGEHHVAHIRLARTSGTTD